MKVKLPRKKQLREELLKKRLALSTEETAAKSNVIIQKLRSYWQDKSIKTILVYLPFRNEVDTWPLINELWQAGKQVAVPVCKENFTIVPSLLLDAEKDLAPGAWNIQEPTAEAFRPLEPADIDLVIVPGVGFDHQGNRLGYGAGYYDRFLPRLRPGVKALAVCYDLQIIASAQPSVHDVPMDKIFTETTSYPQKQESTKA